MKDIKSLFPIKNTNYGGEKVKIFKFKNYNTIQEAKVNSNCLGVSFAKSNLHTVLAFDEANITYINTLENRIVTNFYIKSKICSGTIRDDGKVILVGLENGKTFVFEALTKSLIKEFTNDKYSVNCLDSYKNKFLTGGKHALSYYSYENTTPIITYQSKYDLNIVKFWKEKENNLCIFATADKKLKIFDIRSGKVEREILSGNGKLISDICFYDDNIYYSADNNIFLCDSNLNPIHIATPSIGGIKKLIPTNKKLFSVTATGENLIYINDIKDLSKGNFVNLKDGCLDFDITNSLNRYCFVNLNGDAKIFESSSSENKQDKENTGTSKNYAYFNRGQYTKNENEDTKKISKNKIKATQSNLIKYLYEFLSGTKMNVQFKEVIDTLIRNNSFYSSFLKLGFDQVENLLKSILNYICYENFERTLLIICNTLVKYYAAFLYENNNMISLVGRIKKQLQKEKEFKTKVNVLNRKLEILINLK